MTQPKVTDRTAHKIRYMFYQQRRAAAVNRDGKHEYERRYTSFSEGKAEGIRDILDLLGIEIDLVNVETQQINGGDTE